MGRHHQLDLDLQQLLHDHAVGSEDLPLRKLNAYANEHQLKSRIVTFAWAKMPGYAKVVAALLEKKDGHYAIFCGVKRANENEPYELAMVDPAWQAAHPGEQFNFVNEELFNTEFTGKGLLLKRVYKLSDEEQPFGLRWFIPEFLKLKSEFTQIALGVFLLTLIALATPLFFQNVVDKVLVHESFSTLNVLGVGIVAAIIVNSLLEYLRGNLLLFATNKIDISTAVKTFAHLIHLPIDFFEQVPSGVILKHMQQTEKIRGFLSGNLFFTILELLSLVIFVPFLMLYSLKLTGVVLAFTLIMALVIALLIKPFQHRLDALYQAEGKRQSRLVEAIHGMRTVKSLALEPVEEKNWSMRSAAAIKAYFSVGRISLTARSISQGLEMLMTIAIIWLGAVMVFNGQMTIGALIAFQMLAGRVTGPRVKVVGLIHDYRQVALSVRMLGAVVRAAVEPNNGRVRQPVRGNISFENLNFRYRPDLPLAIKDFSLDIPAGTTLGIVGRSGSGKTTLTKLLQGLYPPFSGLVKIDGIDIRELEKSHLRSSIGVVLQDNYFFGGTVRENISLTKPSATGEEVLRAAAMAGAHEFIQTLPQGYDTGLEENASNLSGGQRQRLAIARALLTNPAILIFDEATSALDPESETVIQKNLGIIARGRTVIIVSHRLSMVAGAQKIIVLDKGLMVDVGTHSQLVERPGIYQQFWQQQMGGR
ncbi:MAG: peptidase domain-containing ABC transporter [Lentisphaeria bacterium]|nr:peptidase domain-containing ABC transporter [Lentisphaeria bacterium]